MIYNGGYYIVLAVLLLDRMTGPCPAGWRVYGTSCYHVYQERANWAAARVRCESYQGHLVSIKSPLQNSIVLQLTAGYPDNQFWIGMYLNHSIGYWLDDYSQVTWSRWKGPGHHTPPDCILMARGGLWAAVNCSRQHQYICQGDFVITTTLTTSTRSTSTLKRTRLTRPSTPLPPTTTTTIITTTKPTTTTTTILATSSSTVCSVTQSTPATPKTSKLTSTLMYLETVKPLKNPGKTYADHRPSAIGLGSLGLVFLVLVLVGVIMLDVSKLTRDFKMLKKNLGHFRKTVRKWCPEKQGVPFETKVGCCSD